VISLTLFSLLFALLLYFPPFFSCSPIVTYTATCFLYFFCLSANFVFSYCCSLVLLPSLVPVIFLLFSLFIVLIFCYPLVLLFSCVAHSFSPFFGLSLFAVLSVYCHLFSFDFLSPALCFFNLLFLSLSFICVTSRPLLMVR
jgi:hypothetical protein